MTYQSTIIGTTKRGFGIRRQVRKAIYTTNAVESVHRQFRKLTKTKGGFANKNALLKLLVESVRKVDASRAKLEPDAVAAEHPL